MKQFYLLRDDVASGPYSLGELLSSGLFPNDQIKKAKDDADWKPVSAFPLLADAVGRKTPPPPAPRQHVPIQLHPASRAAHERRMLQTTSLSPTVKAPRRRFTARWQIAAVCMGLLLTLMAARKLTGTVFPSSHTKPSAAAVSR